MFLQEIIMLAQRTLITLPRFKERNTVEIRFDCGVIQVAPSSFLKTERPAFNFVRKKMELSWQLFPTRIAMQYSLTMKLLDLFCIQHGMELLLVKFPQMLSGR